MTDERNPSNDVLDALADALYETEDYMSHGDCVNLARGALRYLTTEGFVVVRAPGLNHGDELAGVHVSGYEYDIEYVGTDEPVRWNVPLFTVRRSVPEPATGPLPNPSESTLLDSEDEPSGEGTGTGKAGECSGSPATAKVKDLMAALEASVAEAKARRQAQPATKPECPDCRGFKSAYPHLTDEPCDTCGGSGAQIEVGVAEPSTSDDVETCARCGGSGVATTEGNQQ